MSRKPYVREIPKTSWFMRQGRYKRYMAREVTCVERVDRTPFFCSEFQLVCVGRAKPIHFSRRKKVDTSCEKGLR